MQERNTVSASSLNPNRYMGQEKNILAPCKSLEVCGSITGRADVASTLSSSSSSVACTFLRDAFVHSNDVQRGDQGRQKARLHPSVFNRTPQPRKRRQKRDMHGPFVAGGALQRATLRHTIYGTGTSTRLTLDLNLSLGPSTDTPKDFAASRAGYD